MTTYCERKHSTGPVFLAAVSIWMLYLLALAVGCGKEASNGTNSEVDPVGSVPRPTPAAETPKFASFEGTWRGEVVQDDRKYLLRLSFSGDDELSADNRLVLASENSRGGWQEYPGAVCDYKYRATQTGSREGELVVTMVSLRIEGVERRISEKEKTPQTWPYRLKSADVMEITKHSGGQRRTFVMHRD